ncbi:hypothetical protein M5K25_007398 [Dendrobium thyrsiflorum]|uniref:Uncharacterized protein n=1 Tax=Dendrobium thyrsiflorum TaxID=117978 RepID=A0ABD0VE12_DENTH
MRTRSFRESGRRSALGEKVTFAGSKLPSPPSDRTGREVVEGAASDNTGIGGAAPEKNAGGRKLLRSRRVPVVPPNQNVVTSDPARRESRRRSGVGQRRGSRRKHAKGREVNFTESGSRCWPDQNVGTSDLNRKERRRLERSRTTTKEPKKPHSKRVPVLLPIKVS